MTRVVAVALLAAGCGRSPEEERLLDHIDTVRIQITLHAEDGPESPVRGLRGLALHQGRGIHGEPHAMWPDGSPVSADAKVSKEDMLGIVELFGDLRVFEGARLFWSPARPQPAGPPPVEERFRGGLTVVPSCTVTAVYTTGEYHVHVVRALPWDDAAARLLKRLAERVPAAEALATAFERLR